MLTPSSTKDIFSPKLSLNSLCINIHADNLNARLSFTCDFIFNQVLKVNYVFCKDVDEFQKNEGIRIHYGKEKISEAFNIQSDGFLNEQGIKSSKPTHSIIAEELNFFKTDYFDLDFDLFSSVFFFISRYEEWQTFEADKHQRFEANNSLFFQLGQHKKPWVDKWVVDFKERLQAFYPEIKFPNNNWHVVSTIDIDNLYAYKAKSFTRLFGASIKDLLKLNILSINERLSVLIGKKSDPFDIYEDVSSFCNELKIPLYYFFLQRNGTDYDRTIKPESVAYSKVIAKIKKNNANVGIHPSYYTILEPELLPKELKLLSKSSNGEVIKFSRQHYLRFDIRTTPHLLLKNGITLDFTMGFASDVGFRAGTSFPFYYYDFNSERKTELLFVPFCAMDGVFTEYTKCSVEKSYQELISLADEVKKVGGYFITVFHERSFSDHLYPGFGSLYKKLHQRIIQQGST
jgi:hypothetical protein